MKQYSTDTNAGYVDARLWPFALAHRTYIYTQKQIHDKQLGFQSINQSISRFNSGSKAIQTTDRKQTNRGTTWKTRTINYMT